MQYRGDATALELGNGVVLFALLHRLFRSVYYQPVDEIGWTMHPTSILSELAGGPEVTSDPYEFSSRLNANPGPFILPPSKWPPVLMVSDATYSPVILELNPHDPIALLGSQIESLQLMIEYTHEVPQGGITRRFPWLKPARSKLSQPSSNGVVVHCPADYCFGTFEFTE